MQNLHSHKYYSNVFASFKDSHVSYEDYAKRAVELGQKVITSVEHGYQGNYLRCWEMAQQYNLKFVFGVEAYWVKNRTEPDNTNAHIIILARNRNGMLQINKMLAEANKTGFYGKPRVDMELLRTLHPPDVFITTACVAFWGKPKDGSVKWHYSDDNMSRQIDALFAEIYGHFGSSLYLEVQAHNTSWQRIINQHVLDLHYRYGVPLIVGLDSHYIYPEQRLERQILREESGAKKLDEDFEFDDDVYEDYPDEQTIIARFQKQGVLNESEIAEAIANTDIALTFEDIEFDRERKLPKTYRGMDREQCAKEYERRIREGFKKYVDNLQLPPEEAQRRWDDMWTQECGPVIQEGQAVYFLLNSDIIALGQKMGGTYTNSGRGSAGSFFSNKLLGMTGLDRFELPVTLYPGRFMTPERLKTSLPDIDANVSDQLIFAKAQEELMGKDHVAPMIAYGTQKPKSAFRMYARAKNLPMDIQTKVSKQIEAYERAVQNADDEDEKESIFIEDYVDAEYMEYVAASEPYRGIVVSKSQAPCGFLLYDGDIESEIGIIRVLGKSSKKVSYCTVIDGYTADAFGYVKDDELVVTVVAINAAASAKAGLPFLSAEELIARTKNDPATWNIFAKGYTMGVNQCQGAKTIEKLMQYKPRSLQDMSAFVAAIRPGFKSMINKFLAREKFSYGVSAFDAQLHNDSSGSSWFLYQEDTMKILNLAGFPLEETYPIIKAISKKKVKVIEAAHTRFTEGFIAYQKEQGEKSDSKAKENAEMVWKVIYDSAAYQFNACVTGDTVIWNPTSGRWQPTIAEMYRVLNDPEWAKANGHRDLHSKYRSYGYSSGHSMYDDGRIRTNKVVDIRYAGKRVVYRVTLADGKSIKCTENHKFPTQTGAKLLSDLRVGDLLYVRGEYEKCRTKYSWNKIPSKRGRATGPWYKFYQKKWMCEDTLKPCEICGAAYDGELRFELHHIDHDRSNDEDSNFQWLCVSCHKKLHYSQGRVRKGEKGYPVWVSPIVSIEYAGVEDVYDVQMADPYHNFVANDGIVTSNSHSVAVALDAIYGAYLKAHYPLEYYTTLLDTYAAKGDKDKVALIKDEMRRAFNIMIVPCKFRDDNRLFSFDKANNTISDALPSIRNLSVAVAEELFKMRDNVYLTFVDLLVDMTNRKPFNATNIEVLIKMDYFREFGHNGKLMEIWQQFRNGEGTAFKKTYVAATQQKRIAILKDFESSCPDSALSPYDQLSFEAIHYGSPISLFPDAKNTYVVMDVDTKYSPKLSLYSGVTGRTGTVKMKKNIFAEQPLEVGDVVIIGGKKGVDWKNQPKYTYIDGKSTPIPGSKELWVYNYVVALRHDEVITAKEA